MCLCVKCDGGQRVAGAGSDQSRANLHKTNMAADETCVLISFTPHRLSLISCISVNEQSSRSNCSVAEASREV